jgi:hypothetical protein
MTSEHKQFRIKDAYAFGAERGLEKEINAIREMIGWISKHLASGTKVSGVIVARAIDEKLKYAISAVGNITVFEYKVQFGLQQVSLT